MVEVAIICSDVALFVYVMQAKKRKLGLIESDDMDKDDELAEKGAMEETPVVAKIQGNFNWLWFWLEFFMHCTY